MKRGHLQTFDRPVKILVCEDSLVYIDLLRSSLDIGMQYSYELVFVSSMREVLEKLSEVRPDILIGRHHKSKLLSIGTLEQARQRMPSLSVIAITREEDWKIFLLLINAGAQDVWSITRPSPGAMSRSIALAILQKRLESSYIEGRVSMENLLNSSRINLQQVSHDMRTPLNVISGFSELLEKAQSETERKVLSRKQRAAVIHLSSLVNDILDHSRDEASQTKLNESEFNLKREIFQLKNIAEILCEDKNLKLNWKSINSRLYVKGDLIKIKRIVQNLLANAVKYTQKGTISATFISYLESENVGLETRIKDTGIGISREAIDQIFNPFWQESNGDNAQQVGTGLGLSICKSFVEKLGGSISVNSSQGIGTEFAVKLPLKAVSNPLLSETFDTDQIDLKGLTLLVADDSEDNRFIAGKFLEETGAKVEFAETGEQALEKACATCYDLVLMDVHMPGMGGLEAIVGIKNFYKLKGSEKVPKILAFTAATTKAEVDSALLSGADGTCFKPIRKRELIRTLAAFLSKRIAA